MGTLLQDLAINILANLSSSLILISIPSLTLLLAFRRRRRGLHALLGLAKADRPHVIVVLSSLSHKGPVVTDRTLTVSDLNTMETIRSFFRPTVIDRLLLAYNWPIRTRLGNVESFGVEFEFRPADSPENLTLWDRPILSVGGPMSNGVTKQITSNNPVSLARFDPDDHHRIILNR